MVTRGEHDHQHAGQDQDPADRGQVDGVDRVLHGVERGSGPRPGGRHRVRIPWGSSLRSGRPARRIVAHRSLPAPDRLCLRRPHGVRLSPRARAMRDTREACVPPSGHWPSRPCRPGFTGTRLTACNLCEAICGLELTLTDGRSPGSAATPTTRSRAATSAPRAWRWPTCTTTPTGCGGRSAAAVTSGRRSAGTRRSTWWPTGWPTPSNRHGRDAVGVYLGNPNAHALGSATHARAVREVAAHPQPVQRLDGRPGAAPADGLADVRPPAAAADPRPGPHVVPPGPRREPDGLQRLADDHARLPPPGEGDQAARRPDRGARPAPHRDRQDRHRARLRQARWRRGRAARDAADDPGRGPRRAAGVRRRPRPS